MKLCEITPKYKNSEPLRSLIFHSGLICSSLLQLVSVFTVLLKMNSNWFLVPCESSCHRTMSPCPLQLHCQTTGLSWCKQGILPLQMSSNPKCPTTVYIVPPKGLPTPRPCCVPGGTPGAKPAYCGGGILGGSWGRPICCRLRGGGYDILQVNGSLEGGEEGDRGGWAQEEQGDIISGWS